MTDRPTTEVHPSDGDTSAPDSFDSPVPFDQDGLEPVEPLVASSPSWLIDDSLAAADADEPPAAPVPTAVDGPAAGVVRDLVPDEPARRFVASEPAAAQVSRPLTTPSASLATPAPGKGGPATPGEPLRRAVSSVRRSSRRDRRPVAARRTIRHIDPWSMLKLSLVFYACLFLVLLVAGVVLWVIFAAAGVIGNIEHFVGQLLGADHFHFLGVRILEGMVLGGLVLVLLASAFTVLMTVFFNLISDLVGGIELTVVEESSGRDPGRSSV